MTFISACFIIPFANSMATFVTDSIGLIYCPVIFIPKNTTTRHAITNPIINNPHVFDERLSKAQLCSLPKCILVSCYILHEHRMVKFIILICFFRNDFISLFRCFRGKFFYYPLAKSRRFSPLY